MTSNKTLPTLNRYGFQMATPSPLVEEWISSYDNIHPLLDVGCAFGINTFEALKRGIQTIALDMEEGHLEHIRNHLSPKSKPLSTCIFGSLPNKITIPDNSISGILAAEVLHFLDENDVEEALTTLHRKLVQGGTLAFTVLSDKTLAYVASKEKQALYYDRLRLGEKWPGIIKVDDEYLTLVTRYIKAGDMKWDFGNYLPEFLQVFSQRQMEEALDSIGFEIKISKYATHPGFIDPDGLGQLEGINLQVVAEKK